MEKILVASTKTQQRYSFNSNATTLAELKEEMRVQGIDFNNMTITEGITKLGLIDDSSTLPTGNRTVNYNGESYSRIILLTNTQKNIASGAEVSRKDVYSMIKDFGSAFAEGIKETFGRNYTQVPTDDLYNYINDHKAPEDVQQEAPHDDYDEDEEKETKNTVSAEILYNIVISALEDAVGTLDDEEIEVVEDLTNMIACRLEEEADGDDKEEDEITKMLNSIA